jgi:heat shock protein HslJ
MRRLTAFLLLLALALSACGDDDDGGDVDTGDAAATEVTMADLDGRAFESTSITGHDLVENSTVSLTFAEGRISANAGCNTQNGDVEITDGRLTLTSELASTMMGCEEALMDQDQWLAGFLGGEPEIALDGDTLTLTAGDESMELTAEA